MTLKNSFQRRAPFLQRNWISGVNAWQASVMGNVASSPERNGSHSMDHDGSPPQKRRRISSGSLDIDQLIDSPRTSESRSTLRVEVLKILHKDSKKVKTYQAAPVSRDSITTKSNCRITIFDTSGHRHKVLHCQSQVCDVITSKNPVGPYRIARVALPHPFFIPEESIRITRFDDGSFDFSDSYKLVVELENASGSHWPPLDSSDFGFSMSSLHPSTSPRQCVLSSEVDQIFGRHKSQLTLMADGQPHSSGHETDYVMDVDLRWTAGFKAWKRLEKGSMPCITAIDPDTEHLNDEHFETMLDEQVNGVNGVSGSSHDEPFHDPDDELGGDQTPSRSLRAREKNKVYNLKVLSDQAQGREKRRRRERGSLIGNEDRVTYMLPKDQPVCLDFYRCITCGAYHQSMLQLQVHLKTVHSAYVYEVETTNQGPQIRVIRHVDVEASPTKTYQLGRPMEPFNLETFAAGDQSWITSRLGPDNNDEPFKSPRPRKNADTMSIASPAPKTPSRTQRRTADAFNEKRKLIPQTGQRMYHPVSKALLQPGQEVPQRAVDNAWLLQKHHESIGDFSDVTPAEKEYIWEWDSFILQQNLSTTAYFPRAWLSFIREKASWLVAEESRMLELGKHTSVLLARDVLNDEVVDDAFKCINEAREKPRLKIEEHQALENGVNGVNDESRKSSPRASQIRKSPGGCTVCHLPVLGPRLLVCSNKVRRT